jgi:hypothetical protein
MPNRDCIAGIPAGSRHPEFRRLENPRYVPDRCGCATSGKDVQIDRNFLSMTVLN